MKKSKGFKSHTSLVAGFTQAYIIFMSSIFILTYHENYIDIQDYKSRLFLYISGLYVALEVLILTIRFFSGNRSSRLDARGKIRDHVFRDARFFFPLLFAAAVLAGWIMCQWPQGAAFGIAGRQFGAVHLLLCVAVYLLISGTWNDHGKERISSDAGGGGGRIRILICVFSLSVGLELILGILNLWGVDPLNMYYDLVDEQHSFFIGTVGNKNVTANFLCLAMPILMLLFLRSRDPDRSFARLIPRNSGRSDKRRPGNSASRFAPRLIYAALLGMGFYYGIGISCDSFLSGMGAAFLVLVWYCLSGEEGIQALPSLYWILALFTAAWWAVFFSVKGYPVSPFFREYHANGLPGALPGLKVSLILTIITVVLVLFLEMLRRLFIGRISRAQSVSGSVCEGGWTESLRRVRNVIFLILVVAAVLALVTACTVNLLPENRQEALPGFFRQFVLTDEFGSNRGYIWKRTAEAFIHLPLIEKAVGVGADCFYLLMTPLCGEEATLLYGAPYADAHNEFLQLLLTCGFFGVIGYFGTLLAGCFRVRRTGWKLPVRQIVIAAWLAQGIVNSPQVMTTPLMFIFLGICNAAEKPLLSRV